MDIVSKNGNLLLNVPPKADGTLDERTEEILSAVGRWMDMNGEAIYCTRPWVKYGEDNLRFTRKDEILYVITLEWPGAGRSLDISSLGGNQGVGKISEVTMLGHHEKLTWEQNSEGLRIVLPVSPACEHAQSFRVVFPGGIEK